MAKVDLKVIEAALNAASDKVNDEQFGLQLIAFECHGKNFILKTFCSEDKNEKFEYSILHGDTHIYHYYEHEAEGVCFDTIVQNIANFLE